MNETEILEKNKCGYIFNIQRYSLHDGPGIRTLVFLKGCPLRCKWCSNPESQLPHPELAYNANKCIGSEECSLCLRVCNSGAIGVDSSNNNNNNNNNRMKINRELCDNCLKCAEICPPKALITFGKLTSIEDLLNAVEKDGIFYSRSGGGLTIGGGEPLMQPEFAAGLLKEAKRRKMNTALETCGYAGWDAVEKVCAYADTIFYDIKCIDSVKHKEFTGVENKKILENFRRLCARFPNTPIIVRTTIVPGFNDMEEDIIAIANFINNIPNAQYELLAYHRLGESKYGFIGRKCPLNPALATNKEHFASLKEIAKARTSVLNAHKRSVL